MVEAGSARDFVELVERLGHDMISIDLTTRRIRWASPGAVARLGAPLEALQRVELRGETVTAMVSRLFPDDSTRARMTALLDGDLGDGAPFDYRVLDDGVEHWRRATAQIVTTERGQQLDLVSTDITELTESRRAAERAEALRSLSESIHEAGNLDAAVTVVCDEVRRLLRASRASIFFYDDGTGLVSVVRTVRATGVDPAAPTSTRSALEAVHAAHGRVAQFPDLSLHPELPGWEYLTRLGVQSLATAAIGAGARPLGLLNVSMVGERRTFTAHEMKLLADVAALVAAPLAHVALEDERKRAAAQVEAAEERLRAALDATGTAIWELDPSTGRVSWDARCFELWDVDPAGGPDREQAYRRMHPDDRTMLSEAYARALDPEGSGDFAVEYRYFGRGGLMRWLGAKGRCFFGPDRKPRRFIGTIADVTAQHHAEEARIAAERRYREMIETMSEGVGVLDTNGRLVFANRSFAQIFGYAEDAVVGLELRALVFPEDEAAEAERFAEMIGAGGTASRRVRRFQAQGGQEVWASVATVPLREDDRVTGALCVVTDVTASRRLEAKLLQAQKLESLGVLAGGIAHDFNNLLVGVLGNAGLARSELPPESPALDAITSIETAAVRASELTRQLLAYAGKGRFVIGRIDLRRLVEEMGHLLAAVIGKGVMLRYQFGSDVPPIEGDATQLRQVVMNLITNASDAIGERSGIVTVATSLIDVDRSYLAELLLEDELAPGYYVCLQVSDTGVGMTHEMRERIFEPFFTTKFTGRGLGLAAVLGIMRAHRGAIKVYSEVGRGTTFKLLLPAAEVGGEPLPAPSDDAVAAGGGTILVVDDEDTVRSVMKRILVKAGYRVLTAQDGIDGIAVYTAHQKEIRAVILDVTMPRMGGEETFRQLRQLDPEVRVLLASGYSEQEATSQFAGKGLAGFLEKPFRPQSLVEKVRAMLTGRSALLGRPAG